MCTRIMSRSKGQNQQEVVKLDESFKETLARVRPHILELTSPENAQLCKVWLDKLNISSSQRLLRNEYLAELCRQLKAGHIGGIFSRPPPDGLLLPLPKSYHMVCISSSLSDLSDYAVRPYKSCFEPSAKCMQSHHQRNRTPLRRRTTDSTNTSRCSHTINISPTVRFQDDNATNGDHIGPYKQRINMLSTIITDLQAQNDYLKSQILEYQENCTNNEDEQSKAYINKLSAEVIALKTKLAEAHKMKDFLETNQTGVTEEYHGTIIEQLAMLKHQLCEAQLRNEELNHNVAIMAENLKEIIHGKDEEANAMEKHWMDKLKFICQKYDTVAEETNRDLRATEELLEKKDVELTQKHTEQKYAIETMANKIQELETKLETKMKDEDRLQRMLEEQYATMKEEFSKMRNEIDIAAQKQNYNLTSKISALKRAVIKLEKSKEKLEYEYEKRIVHITKNKDLVIKALQLQLQGQKEELCTSMSIKKQCEIDSLVSLLEERYRTLLAEVETATESQNQEYLKKIAVLEDQVLNLKRNSEKT